MFSRQAFPEFFHILSVIRIPGIALCGQDLKGCLTAQCGRYIQHIRQHTFVSGAVLRHILIDQILHDHPVNGKSLSHEAESSDHMIFPIHDWQGIDPWRIKGCRQLMKSFETFFLSGQISHGALFTVSFLHKLHIFTDTGIITGPGKKGSHCIDALPEGITFGILLKRHGHQKGASVQILFLLYKMDPSIPHHHSEIAL